MIEKDKNRRGGMDSCKIRRIDNRLETGFITAVENCLQKKYFQKSKGGSIGSKPTIGARDLTKFKPLMGQIIMNSFF